MGWPPAAPATRMDHVEARRAAGQPSVPAVSAESQRQSRWRPFRRGPQEEMQGGGGEASSDQRVRKPYDLMRQALQAGRDRLPDQQRPDELTGPAQPHSSTGGGPCVWHVCAMCGYVAVLPVMGALSMQYMLRRTNSVL